MSLRLLNSPRYNVLVIEQKDLVILQVLILILIIIETRSSFTVREISKEKHSREIGLCKDFTFYHGIS